MSDEKTELLIEKFFDGVLAPEERTDFDDLVASDPGFWQSLEDARVVRAVLADARIGRFGPSFADDVVRDAQDEAALGEFLRRHRAAAFGDGFCRRIDGAIRNEHAEATHFFNPELSEFLERLFPRVAIPALTAGCVATVMNVSASAVGAPLIDALLGLPGDEAIEISIIDMSAEQSR